MKKVKYIFALVLFLITFSFIGESYIFYLDNFSEDFYKTTMYKPDYITDEEMKLDIKESLQKHNVGVYAVKEEIKSSIDKNISIFGSSEANKYLQDKRSIHETIYKSMFSGKVSIHYYDLDEIPDMGDFEDYYLIGNTKNIKAFKISLIDTYGGNHPKAEDDNKESKNNVLYIWAIVLIVILLFTYYDIIFQKKEVLVKITFGEKASKIIVKNILYDTITFACLFMIAFFFLSLFTNTQFHFNSSLMMFVIFILINSLLYFSLFKYNLQEVFSNSKSKSKLLKINYGLKVITIVLAITLLSGSIALIVEGIKFYQQKDFFEDHKDYSYVQFDYKLTGDYDADSQLINKSANVREKFYKEYFNQSVQLVNVSDNLDINTPTILANRNSLSYLKNKIPQINENKFQEKVYYIMPKKHASDRVLHEIIKDIYRFYNNMEDKDAPENEIIIYDTNTNIISIDEIDYLNRSKLLHNPTIIFDNTGSDTNNIDTETSFRRTSYAHDIMYLISDDEYQSFITNHNLIDEIHIKTNVYDLYKYNWSIIKRGIIISSVLLSLVLILELIIINLILRLEYEINSIELSIKKILGYSTWEKNKRIIFITLSATVMSIMLSLIVHYIFAVSQASYLLYGGVIILIMELVFIFVNIAKIEKSKIQNILKGGTL